MMEPFHVGFTGSRKMPTNWQQQRLLELLVFLQGQGAVCLHHGDCVGGDAIAHALAVRAGFESITIHPPTIEKLRAFCWKQVPCPPKGISIHEPAPYLSRNDDIVHASSILIAVPKGQEVVRSGTWATVRHARAQEMTIYIIYPFRFESENDPWDYRVSHHRGIDETQGAK